MSNFEILFFIVVDTLSSNLFFIPNTELAVWAVPKLSSLPLPLLLSLAFVGVFFAHLINYTLGRVIFNILVPITTNKEAIANIKILREIYARFGYYLLTLSFIPVFGKFVVLLAGFTRLRLVTVLFISSLVKVIFYGVKILFFI